MTTGKTTALTRWTFVGKVISLLLNMLSRLVIAFLPRSKHLLISWLQSPSAVILDMSLSKLQEIEKDREAWSAAELMLLNCGIGKALESPLECKEIKSVNCKGNQS